MRPLEVIAKTNVTASEAFGFRGFYDPEFQNGGPKSSVAISLNDPDGSLRETIRERQKSGGVILLREVKVHQHLGHANIGPA